MNLAQALVLFFAFYASREGVGAEVPYPGPMEAYQAKHSVVNQDVLARFTIFLSLNLDIKSGEAYNIADEDKGTSWEVKRPPLAADFGLVDMGPAADSNFSIVGYMRDHSNEWVEWVKQNGLRDGAIEGTDFGFLGVMLGRAVFGREYGLGEARILGWGEERDSVQGYLNAFRLMREKRIVP